MRQGSAVPAVTPRQAPAPDLPRRGKDRGKSEGARCPDGRASPPGPGVLSIAKLSSSDVSGRGVGYYVAHIANDRDDYYNGSGEAPGRWLGQGAAALGLDG
ncbi:MAG: relaxase domain-containing protein, partial [Acidimicrobiales bacterium]